MGYQESNTFQSEILKKPHRSSSRELKRIVERDMVTRQSLHRMWFCRQVCLYLGHKHKENRAKTWRTFGDSKPG